MGRRRRPCRRHHQLHRQHRSVLRGLLGLGTRPALAGGAPGGAGGSPVRRRARSHRGSRGSHRRALRDPYRRAHAVVHRGRRPGGDGRPGVEPVTSTPTASAPGTTTTTSPRPAPLVSQAALLLSIFVGGWVAAVTAGRFEFRLDMGDGFREIVTGSPPQMIGVLFVGGVLVGFGTRLAGGCSSGHGLNGCGRLHPDSIVATAVFFGTAVLVSFLLWKVV
ncbi:YeeE/YedE family protein [Plantactinospora veratri]